MPIEGRKVSPTQIRKLDQIKFEILLLELEGARLEFAFGCRRNENKGLGSDPPHGILGSMIQVNLRKRACKARNSIAWAGHSAETAHALTCSACSHMQRTEVAPCFACPNLGLTISLCLCSCGNFIRSRLFSFV